jgi:hypothetical protein
MSKKIIRPSLAEDLPLAEDLGAGRNKHGVICVANESRFVAGHYSEQLTGLTIGWKDPENIDAILDALFPEVAVSRRFDFKKANNAEAFLSEVDDIRAIGAPFKRVDYSGTEASSKTLNKGLTVSIDHDQCDDVEAEVVATIGRLQSRLARNDLRRGMAILDANDANDTATWGAASNPDKDVRTRLRASADSVGIFPNVVAYGELAWHYRLDAYEVAGRQNGGQRSSYTPEQLAAYFMADKVVPVKARYQSSATAKSAILAARIYAYLAMQGISKDDPSAIKRFRSAARGGKYGVYREERAKCTEVSVEHYSNIVYTGLGIVSLDVTQGSDV